MKSSPIIASGSVTLIMSNGVTFHVPSEDLKFNVSGSYEPVSWNNFREFRFQACHRNAVKHIDEIDSVTNAIIFPPPSKELKDSFWLDFDTSVLDEHGNMKAAINIDIWFPARLVKFINELDLEINYLHPDIESEC